VWVVGCGVWGVGCGVWGAGYGTRVTTDVHTTRGLVELHN